tara:strand:+ start:153 stop:359 length:207 start_codon:yes stop_codon:yes gene_type:complete
MTQRVRKLKNPFKITKSIVEMFPDLDRRDIGSYGIVLPHQDEVMTYENKHIAVKAYAWFKKAWNLDDE